MAGDSGYGDSAFNLSSALVATPPRQPASRTLSIERAARPFLAFLPASPPIRDIHR